MGRAGWRVLRLDRTDSTNQEARRRAEAGEAGPLWIAAAEQTAGRGRRGRVWDSASGNLFCTALLRPGCGPAEAAELAFAAGLAAAETADLWIDAARVRLKWPNDVLVDGAKAAGVLLESGEDGQGRWLAVGIGLNLVSAPADTPYPATFLAAHLPPDAEPPTADAALARLAAAFEARVDAWRTGGFAPLRAAWLTRAKGLGEPVSARLAAETVEGVFEDLDPAGALVLRTASGARRVISAGDVFFPGAGMAA